MNHIEKTNYNNRSLTYKELSYALDGEVHEEQLGRYLGNLSSICIEIGLPCISAIVVNSYTGYPGDGFFKAFYRHIKRDKWDEKYIQCLNDIEQCKIYDKWRELAILLNIEY